MTDPARAKRAQEDNPEWVLAQVRFDALDRHRRGLPWGVEHYLSALPPALTAAGSPVIELMISLELGLKKASPEALKQRLDASHHELIDRLAERQKDLEAEATRSVEAHEQAAASMPPTGSGGQPAGEAEANSASAPSIEAPNHELVRCLGIGGFGQVWLARHVLTEHHRACKLIPEEKALELAGLRRLKRDVPPHPNLFPIEDVGAGDGWLYCLMPLADPASDNHAVLDHTSYKPLTLNLHLKRHGRRSSAEVASIGRQLADAVRHLHAHGVTHGDIKPANIMRLGGKWTLADYGLARDLSSPSGGGHTPGYTPPEGPGSTSADQYALGVVLMEMLTGWPASMLANFRETPIERFKLDRRGPLVRDIILRATAEDPHDRFGSMDEMIAALDAVAPEDGARRTRWFVPAAVTIGVAALIVGALAMRPEPESRRSDEPPMQHRASIGATTPHDDAASSAPSASKSQLRTSAGAPPAIVSFTVRHYRYDPATNRLIATGPIGADNPAARAEDDVTVHASFTAPVSFYLLSLDADGRVRLRIPESPTESPALADSFDYPSDPAADPDGYLFNLSEGPGVQGFMLLVSEDPLPPWSDWVASRGEPTWSADTLSADAVVLFDGVERTILGASRGPAARRGELVQDPIDWVAAQRGLAGVRFIAFPVLPKVEN